MAARTCTLMLAVLLMGASMVLMIGALSYDQWFATNEDHRVEENGIVYTMTIEASIDPFRTSWFVSSQNSTMPAPEIDRFSGKVKDLCSIEVVKDIFKDAQSSCNYIKDIGPAVAGMAIFSIIMQGIALSVVLAGILRKSGGKCFGFFQELFVLVSFLSTLIVSALWGAVATIGKDKINEEIPKFFMDRLGVRMSGQGEFAAQGSLWLAVGSVIPSLVALVLTTAACCCMKNYYNEKYGLVDGQREKTRQSNYRDIERLERELGTSRRT